MYPIYTDQRDPDHGDKRSLSSVGGYVMHYTYGGNAGDKATIGAHDPRSVSAHYFIPDDDDPGAALRDKTGIYEFVPPTTIAAAVGTCVAGWGNAQTISVEIGNNGREAPTARQLAKLDYLIAYLDKRLGRKPPIRSHAEIALPAGRKAGDPNSTFPLENYKRYRQHVAPTAPRYCVVTRPMGPRYVPSWLAPYKGTVLMGQKLRLVTVNSAGWAKVVLPGGAQRWLAPGRYRKV